MRTLTFGILVVGGGILAALPFRRYQAIPDASSGPVQATGPTQSSLDHSPLDLLVEVSPSVTPGPPRPETDQLIGYRHHEAIRAEAVPSPRHVSIPLTFEDLDRTVPQPPTISDRYSATVRSQQSMAGRSDNRGMEMPRMESLALSQQNEILSNVTVVDGGTVTGDTTAPQTDRTHSASLASTTRQTSSQTTRFATPTPAAITPVTPAPAAPDAPRPRHWIRQPD